MKSVKITTYRNNGLKSGAGGFVVIGDKTQLPSDVATRDWVISQEYVSLDELGEKLKDYVTNEGLSIVLGNFWKKDELIRDDLYLKFIEGYVKAKYADKAGDSDLWQGHSFDDYLDQPVKTGSDVLHNSVTARAFTEEDNPDNEVMASSRLKETGSGYIGDMDNVSDEANTATRGSMLIKGLEAWSPMYPTYSEVESHDNLLMPVFNTLTKEWQFITVPSGGENPPPQEAAFPYTFPIMLS